MEQIIAIQERKGEFEGHPFHFYNVFTTSANYGPSWRDGLAVIKYKVPAHVFESKDFEIGAAVSFVFDRFGKVCDVLGL